MTVLVTMAIALFGAIAFRSLPVAALPTVDYPTIQVSATLPGANPETMAASVATPLEREFSTIAGIDSMSSTNTQGTSQITVQFDLSRNIDAAAQDIQSAISKAGGRLPPNMPRPPSFQKVNPAEQPVLAATWHTMHALGLDPELLQEFLDAMVMDLTISRYATWEDLRGYMRGSAAVIGELMAPLLGARGPDALGRAAGLGEAFQLTNFIRDVGEDHTRGRIYLPQSDLARFGVSEALLAEAVRTGVPSRQVRSLVAFEVRRAVNLYAAARPGLTMVDARSRPCLEMAFTLYRRILHHVIANDFNVFERRLVVPPWQRLATVGNVAARTAGHRVISVIDRREVVASSRRSTPRRHS
jgi:phytoene/squalene synthetase